MKLYYFQGVTLQSGLLHNFRDDLFQQEGFGTLDALRFAFVGNDQHPAAFGAGLGQRFLPGREIAIRIIDTTEEGAPLARLALHQFAAIGRAGHADLQEPGLRIAAIRETAAGDELPKAPVTDDQFLAAGRAGAPDGFGSALGDGHFGLRFLTSSAKGV